MLNKIHNEKYLYLTILVLIIIIIILFILPYFHPTYKIEDRVGNIKKQQKQASATIQGWIRVEGTNIDYPVVDGNTMEEDNYDYTWMRYETDHIQNRIAILGHNLLNVSHHPLITDPHHTRFEQLLSFVYTDFAKQNQFIQFTIGNDNYLYRIYAIYFTNEHDNALNLEKKDMKEYIKKAKEKSYFDFGVNVNSNDKLITLITCTRFFGNRNDYEFKVEGRLVRKLEKIDNKRVKETKQYKDIKQTLEEGEKNEETKA